MRIPNVVGFNFTMEEANRLTFDMANALLKLLPEEKEETIGTVKYR